MARCLDGADPGTNFRPAVLKWVAWYPSGPWRRLRCFWCRAVAATTAAPAPRPPAVAVALPAAALPAAALAGAAARNALASSTRPVMRRALALATRGGRGMAPSASTSTSASSTRTTARTPPSARTSTARSSAPVQREPSGTPRMPAPPCTIGSRAGRATPVQCARMARCIASALAGQAGWVTASLRINLRRSSSGRRTTGPRWRPGGLTPAASKRRVRCGAGVATLLASSASDIWTPRRSLPGST